MIWEIDESARAVEGLDADGRARPEYAASLGLRPAPFGRRVLATVIEVAVVLVLQLPLLLGALPALIAIATAADVQQALLARTDLVVIALWAGASYLLTTAFIIVQLVLHGRSGTTIGKAITGIRSVNVRTLERPGFWRGAVVRYLVLWGSFLVPVIGPLVVIALSPLFDREGRGRGWADFAGATWFVDARHGLNPYDAKRMRIARKTVASDLTDERSELPSLATPAGRPAGEIYIPVSRSSGGVLGVPANPAPASAAAAPANPVPAGAAPAPASAPAPGAPPSSVPVAPSSAAPAAPAFGAAFTPAPSAPAGAWQPPVLLPAPAVDAAAATPHAASAPAAAPSTPATPATPAAPATPATPARVELVLDTGEALEVSGGGILIGRSPATGPGEDDLTAVRILDQTMSVSKTHLAVLRRDGRVVVVDRGSTNGSSLSRGGADRDLAPGEPVALHDGDTIRFGDRHAEARIS